MPEYELLITIYGKAYVEAVDANEAYAKYENGDFELASDQSNYELELIDLSTRSTPNPSKLSGSAGN